MASKSDTRGSRKEQGRKARLAEELRANLQRRKAQTRSRRIGEADQRPEGIRLADDGSDLKSGEPS